MLLSYLSPDFNLRFFCKALVTSDLKGDVLIKNQFKMSYVSEKHFLSLTGFVRLFSWSF